MLIDSKIDEIKDMFGLFDDPMDKYTQIDENGVKYILNSIIDSRTIFQGLGVDLGGGICLISSVLEKNFPLKNIFCIEIVEEAIKHCHKKIQKFILGKQSEKILSVNGSFDKMNKNIFMLFRTKDFPKSYIIFWV